VLARSSPARGRDRCRQNRALPANRRCAASASPRPAGGHCRFGIERLDQPAQRRLLHHPFHLGQKPRPPRRLGVALKSTAASVSCFISPSLLRANPPHCALYHVHWPMAFAGVP
jgi:hypothetical protein